MRPVLVFALALSAVGGCSLLPGDYNDYGDMTATVRGALDLDLHGTAHVSIYSDRPGAVVYLDITNDFARHIFLTTADTVALAVGRYSLADGSLTAIEYEVDNRTERLFVGDEGGMTVRRVDEVGDAFGTFSFEAEDADGERVTVEDEFRARDFL